MYDNKLFKRRKRISYPSSGTNSFKDALQKASENIERRYNYIKRIYNGLRDNPDLPQKEIDRVKDILATKINELWD